MKTGGACDGIGLPTFKESVFNDICAGCVSVSIFSSKGLDGSTGLCVSLRNPGVATSKESFNGFTTPLVVFGAVPMGLKMVSLGATGGSSDFGLTGRNLRSKGFPEFCPHTANAIKSRVVMPRKRFITPKVATSGEINYFLQ